MQTALVALSAIIGVGAFFPYLRDTLSLKTKPHAYTWLIWAITQGTGVFGIWYGGGGWGAGLALTISLFCVIVIFFFSLRYGTKNITRSDTFVLILAMVAVLVWWQLKQPLLAVIMVSAIDFFGYIPSFRKSYHEPWSETLISWIGFSLSNIFAILALNEFNLLTVTYLATITVANLFLFFICFFRRRSVPKPIV